MNEDTTPVGSRVTKRHYDACTAQSLEGTGVLPNLIELEEKITALPPFSDLHPFFFAFCPRYASVVR